MERTEQLSNYGFDHIPSPEEVERIMAYKATMLAMKQLDEGTARAQVITHYLQVASPRENIERRMLEAKIALLEGQLAACRNEIETNRLITEAIESLKFYRGGTDDENIY